MPLYTQGEKCIFCNFQLTCSSFYRLRHISSGVISTFSGTLVHNGVYKKNFIELALSLEWTIFTAEEMFLLLYHWDFYESFTILPTIFWICKQLNKLNLKLTLMLDDETLTKIAEKSVFFISHWFLNLKSNQSVVWRGVWMFGSSTLPKGLEASTGVCEISYSCICGAPKIRLIFLPGLQVVRVTKNRPCVIRPKFPMVYLKLSASHRHVFGFDLSSRSDCRSWV